MRICAGSSEDNFDAGGAQKLRLSELTAPFVHARS